MTAHPLPKAVLAQHTVILGKTRSGKSSTMRGLVEELLDDKKPVCIIDPKGDWWGLKSSASGKRAGYEVVIFGGAHADVPINAHSGAVVGELVATGNRPCIIDLGGWMVGERTRFFIEFASMLFKRTHGARWLCIDECHNFAPQGKIMDPDAGKMLHWANRLASEGAGKGITLISASQRPQKVHKDYLTSHETLIAMRVIHPLDRKAMKEWMDGCADPTKGAEVLNTLAGMQRGEGWVWSPEINFGPKRIQFPMFKTYDSFAVQTGEAGQKLSGWAAVDLDDVKAKLAIVVEEAKANDPKELRAQVAALKGEIAKLTYKSTNAAPAAKPYKFEIVAAEKRGFEKAEKQFSAAAEREAREQLHRALVGLRDVTFKPLAAHLDEAIKAAKNYPVDVKQHVRFVSDTPAPVARPAAQPNPKPAPIRQPAAPTGDGTYSRAQTRVLLSLAMWRALDHESPTREMVAAAAGYKSGSGGFNNLLGGLGTMGVIGKPMAGKLSLLVDGVDVISKMDGRDMLIKSLKPPHRKIIGALIDAGAMTREAIAEATNYMVGSGGFNNLLGNLNTLGITIKPQPGYVALSDWAQELLTGSAERMAA